MCVWHLLLHTSCVGPEYSVTLYLHRVPCAYLSRASGPDRVAGWSIVWCHLGYISAFPQTLAEFASLHSDAKFLHFCFFIIPCTSRKSVFQAPAYHDRQNGKWMSGSLSSISFPNYIDYTSLPFQFAQCYVGPAFSLGFMKSGAVCLLLCILFHVE